MKVGTKAFGPLNYKVSRISLMRNATPSKETTWIDNYIRMSNGDGIDQD